MNEVVATLALHQLPRFSKAKFLDHYSKLGSSLEIWKLYRDEAIERFAIKEYEEAHKWGITLLPYTSSDYPLSVKELSDAPLILYIKGSLPPQSAPKVAIVGTRAATEWGKEMSYRFAKELSSSGAWIVSGLARGIDTRAHQGALESSVAIIGSGLLHIYPKENEALAEQISQRGAVVSELGLRVVPTRFSFPRRNRLIAALSDALILAEAPIKSGAMITMELGHKLKKPLFALPGRAMSESFAGNHALINDGKAKLLDHPKVLANFLKIGYTGAKEEPQKRDQIVGDEKKIVDFLSQSDVSIEELSHLTRLPINKIQVIVTKLVLKNLAVELPGKRYRMVL